MLVANHWVLYGSRSLIDFWSLFIRSRGLYLLHACSDTWRCWSSFKYFTSRSALAINKLSVFFIIKPTRCTNFTNLFWHETLYVSDSSSVHNHEFIHCTLSNGVRHTAFEQDQDGTAVPSWSCSKVVYKPIWHISLLSLQWINSWWWTEELSETCRVSCQNKFMILVRLVDFIYKEMCYDAARSHERKNYQSS
jgi:hypothetical protein